MSESTKLKKFFLYATVPPKMDFIPYANGTDFILYVPAESLEEYKSASGWSKLKHIEPLPE